MLHGLFPLLMLLCKLLDPLKGPLWPASTELMGTEGANSLVVVGAATTATACCCAAESCSLVAVFIYDNHKTKRSLLLVFLKPCHPTH